MTRLSPPITTAQRRPNQALPTNHNGTAPPRPGSAHQSQWHGAPQTRPCPPITMARCLPDQALPSHHNGTAPPRPGCPQQSQRHGAAQTRLSPAITTAQRPPNPALPSNRPRPPITTAWRHPDQALPTNHSGTALPRPGSPQQSQRHSDTETTLSPAITTAQRRRDPAFPTNHNGTAPAQRRTDQALPSNHNGTAPQCSAQATPSRPILRAQRIGHKTVARERSRTLVVVCDTVPKSAANTVPPPDPPDKNKNPSLRIREKQLYVQYLFI